MTLLARLMGEQPTAAKLSVRHFIISLRLLASGRITRAQFDNQFSLSAEEKSDLSALITKYQASSNKQQLLANLEDRLMLAEFGLYGLNTEAAVQTEIDGLS